MKPALLLETPVAQWIFAHPLADSEAEAEVIPDEIDIFRWQFWSTEIFVEPIVSGDVHHTHGCLEISFGSCLCPLQEAAEVHGGVDIFAQGDDARLLADEGRHVYRGDSETF